MTEANLKPEIEMESQTSSSDVVRTESSAAQVQTPAESEDRPVVIKEYHYKNKNGKDVRVIRKYTIKHDKSYKVVNNKEPIKKYIEEHKDKYINLPSHRQITTIIDDVKRDLDLKISRTGVIKILEEVIGRKQMTIEEVNQKAEERRKIKESKRRKPKCNTEEKKD